MRDVVASQNKKFSIEGNKMKKFSSLCLALVLSVSGLFNLNVNAISFFNLDKKGIAYTVADYQDYYLYREIEIYFYGLLVANGERKLAEDYKWHRHEFFKSLKKSKVGDIDEAIFEMATNFFKDKFKPDPFNPAAVGIYALIFGKSYGEAEEELIQYFASFGRRRAMSL